MGLVLPELESDGQSGKDSCSVGRFAPETNSTRLERQPQLQLQ